ncbi:MAG: Dam family site-specific DNA-(adenine-N6)-methyltransferase [Ignavibacteriales bacterium]|nr:Dam family site-specific DNA-(adenine-N6)-methyltransferase [Ignavibacteriales bacterium]
MKTIVPPIKSQGIKTKLVPWIMDVVKKAQPKGKWVEPFLGTGVVAFNSGFKEALLSDTNPHIINFYKGIQDGIITPSIVKRYLEEEGEKLSVADENGYVYFRVVRDRFNKNFSPLDFLFLSRTGFNGMMRFGKKGNWNIPFCKKSNRFAQSYVTKIVNQVSKVQSIITPKWTLVNKKFSDIIPQATKDDIIYCDPPYFGRYVDYFNGWTEQDEELLCNQLSETKAKFILSTWHHNDYRDNEMIKKYWNKFNIVTKDHFYHSGGKVENRRTIVEALVCNFELDQINKHNHGLVEKSKIEQLSFELVNY